MRQTQEARARTERSWAEFPIRKNRLSPAARQKILWQPRQLFGMVLIAPQEHPCRTCPQLRQRCLRLKYSRRIWKFRTIPKISARLVQHPHASLEIEIQA